MKRVLLSRGTIRRLAIGLFAVALLVLAGCSSSSNPGSPVHTVPSSVPPVPKVYPPLQATEASDVPLQAYVGQQIVVSLHSLYWSVAPPTPSSILSPGHTSARPGVGCPPYPGSGCGIIQVSYTALQTGVVHISASRTTCGEALLCAPSQRSWKLTITVLPDR